MTGRAFCGLVFLDEVRDGGAEAAIHHDHGDHHSGDHHFDVLGHADGSNDGVDGENKINYNDLCNGSAKDIFGFASSDLASSASENSSSKWISDSAL